MRKVMYHLAFIKTNILVILAIYFLNSLSLDHATFLYTLAGSISGFIPSSHFLRKIAFLGMNEISLTGKTTKYKVLGLLFLLA